MLRPLPSDFPSFLSSCVKSKNNSIKAPPPFLIGQKQSIAREGFNQVRPRSPTIGLHFLLAAEPGYSSPLTRRQVASIQAAPRLYPGGTYQLSATMLIFPRTHHIPDEAAGTPHHEVRGPAINALCLTHGHVSHFYHEPNLHDRQA